MLGFLTNWAINKSDKIMDSRPPDFVIGPKEDPYMLRWWGIPRNRFFNIYLHKILHDDDDRALHDHPWPSLSLMCAGTIKETYTTDNGLTTKTKILRIGDWRYRGPEFAHRLELVRNDIARTIFMTGPRIREWGFLCPQGWRHWKDFVSSDDKGAVGRGCGEIEITDDEGILNEFHCKECGFPEIQLHNYDGFCRNCIEHSSYKREPEEDDWLRPVHIYGLGLVFCLLFWFGVIKWWFA
jgi:hypothetical protein